MREERADRTDMVVRPDTTGECRNRDAVEILSWYVTGGEQIQVQECEMFRRPSQVRKVIRADSHQHDSVPQSQERDETQPIIVTLEYADAMCAPEHHSSTLRTVHVNLSHPLH